MIRQHIATRTVRSLASQVGLLTVNSLVVFDVDNTLIHCNDRILRPMLATRDATLATEILDPIFNATPRWRAEKLTSMLYLQAEYSSTEDAWLQFMTAVRNTGAHMICLTAFVTPSYGVVSNTALHRAAELDRAGLSVDTPGAARELSRVASLRRSDHYFATYRNIVFSGNESKGEALASYVSHHSLCPDRVIVFDDRDDHLEDVSQWWAKAFGDVRTHLVTVHYEGAFCSDLDPALARFQVDYFLRSYTWLSDALAAKAMQQNPEPLGIERIQADEHVKAVVKALSTYSKARIVLPRSPDYDTVVACYCIWQFMRRVLHSDTTMVVSEEERRCATRMLQRYLPSLDESVFVGTSSVDVSIQSSAILVQRDPLDHHHASVIIGCRGAPPQLAAALGPCVCWLTTAVGSVSTMVGEILAFAAPEMVRDDAVISRILYVAIRQQKSAASSSRDVWMANLLLLQSAGLRIDSGDGGEEG